MPGIVELIPLILGATSGGSAPPKTAGPTPAQAQTAATNTRNTQEAALSQQLPGLQAQTGGSLSPEALLQLSTLLSGQANAPGIGGSVQDLLAKINGGAPSTPGLTPGGAFA